MLYKLLSFKGSQNYYILIKNSTITCSINVIFIEKRLYLGTLSTEREGGISISPLTANNSKTLEGNDKMDL